MVSGDAGPDVDAEAAGDGLEADSVLAEGETQADGDAGTTTAMDESEDMATAPETEDGSLQQPTGDFSDTVLSMKSLPLLQLLSDSKGLIKLFSKFEYLNVFS